MALEEHPEAGFESKADILKWFMMHIITGQPAGSRMGLSKTQKPISTFEINNESEL